MAAYKLWHEFKVHIPKIPRYSLGVKIDCLFTEVVELVFGALSAKNKLPFLETATRKFDTLKFMLQVLWRLHAIDDKKYTILSEELGEIGRQLGGWLRKTDDRENSAR